MPRSISSPNDMAGNSLLGGTQINVELVVSCERNCILLEVPTQNDGHENTACRTKVKAISRHLCNRRSA